MKLTTIFGNAGSTEESLLKAFPSDFRYVLALQEAPAIAMADGYAQVTGEAVLVNLHTAAGMGNALGNIESAWHNRTPMIITAGQQTREMLMIEPYLTNAHPLDLPKPFVKWAYEPPRAEDVPAALMRRVALAERDLGTNRKVIDVVGDGSANYVIQSLWTAAQHKLPILFEIVRNGAYTVLKSFARQFQTPRVPGLDLPGLDFVSLARGYGVSAERIASPAELPGGIRRGMSSEIPQLLEVEVDPAVPPLI